jgi:adenine-specific DNA-methyltransferase
MPTPLEKFQSLLRELFQFEQADLDFGVYRIMNLRRARMEKWLNEELPARAREILAKGGATADEDLGRRLDDLKAELLRMDPGAIDADGNLVNEAWANIPAGENYLKLKAQADRAPARTAAGMEPLVYNHLYDFFSRYYETGDFIPKRRRSFAPDGRDIYAIPWDGEEVVLHWANKDQYYIKTGERFTHYRWQSDAGGRTFTVEFRLTDADLPANNNKDAKKKFNLLVVDKVEWQDDTSTLIVPFHYRGLTPEEEGQYVGTQEAKLRESVIKRTVETLRELPVVAGVPQLATALMAPKRDAAGQERRDKDGNAVPLLPHHLNRWAVKNESDFFIHKDLRRFLSGELDYFLKSVVLNLDNLLAAGEQRAEPNFRLLDAVKRLGTEIVDFVSQLEDFQKALFEKKKFVLETSWCLTLDRIPASVKEEVYAAILANDRQWEEWESLYKISQWPADLVTVAPRTREFLEAYQYLLIETGLRLPDGSLAYSDTLINGLLGSLVGLDAQTDGVIINSENYQALNLLRSRYSEAFGCVYIDPPYNSKTSEILYKNTYKHSSWSTLMHDRLAVSRTLTAAKGSHIVAIDENEQENLGYLLRSLFCEHEIVCVSVIHNKKGIQGDYFSYNHEFAYFCIPPALPEMKGRPLPEDEWDWDPLRKWGQESERWTAKNCFYPIVVRDDEIVDFGDVLADDEHPEGACVEQEDGSVWIYPIDSKGVERKWRYARVSVEEIRSILRVRRNRHGNIEIEKARTHANVKTVWDDSRYIAGDYGTTVLTQCGVKPHDNLYPKSVFTVLDSITAVTEAGETVLDYFGGSGTTGHAAMSAIRAGEQRKYVLVEMGEYFATVLKPRLQKIAFSENWKDGAPVRHSNPPHPNNTYNGISHCIKVLRLESYEDALDNIEFNSGAAPGAELVLEFRRDYELRYALDWESKDCPTRLAVEQLDTPFDYTLTLRRESGTVEVKPDLPETFAYLIGLHTRRRFHTERDGVSYLIYTGTLHADGTEVAVLWRTCRGWTEADLKAEKDWWSEQRETLAPGATRIYVNGASAIEGHHSLDAEFKTRMHGTPA